jgi:hypothetical protein
MMTAYLCVVEKRLKESLRQFGLSTKGDRKTLIERHKNFVLRYNAECDKYVFIVNQ